MVDDQVKRTAGTYDRIALAYLEKWRDRSIMERQFTRFVMMLPAQTARQALVADVGCGPGFDAASLRERGLRVVSVDLSFGMLSVGAQEFPGLFVQGDMCNLPFAAAFDGVWANASMLHLPRASFHDALAELHRILKAHGLLYVAVKEGDGSEWKTNSLGDSQPRFFTFWRVWDLDDALANQGFEIVDGWSGPEGELHRWLVRFARKKKREP